MGGWRRVAACAWSSDCRGVGCHGFGHFKVPQWTRLFLVEIHSFPEAVRYRSEHDGLSPRGPPAFLSWSWLQARRELQQMPRICTVGSRVRVMLRCQSGRIPTRKASLCPSACARAGIPAWSVDTILTGLLSYFLSDAESGCNLRPRQERSSSGCVSREMPMLPA